jgi:hypothetical protein
LLRKCNFDLYTSQNKKRIYQLRQPSHCAGATNKRHVNYGIIPHIRAKFASLTSGLAPI